MKKEITSDTCDTSISANDNIFNKENSTRFVNHQGYALPKELVEEFFKKGYIILEKLFTSTEVATIKHHMANAYVNAKVIAEKEKINKNIEIGAKYRCDYEGDNGNSASILAINNQNREPDIQLISWVGGVCPELITLGRQEKLTVPVGQLLGSNKVAHLINQAHYKISGDKVKYDIHQDIQNRRTFDPNWQDLNKKGSFVQTLAAIDAATENNGPLVIIPNSHNEDLFLDKVPGGEREAEVLKKFPHMKDILKTLLLKPGDVVLMHPLLIHWSNENVSCETRDMFINGFSYPGANTKDYPGKGSAQEIYLNILPDLVTETNEFVLSILGEENDTNV